MQVLENQNDDSPNVVTTWFPLVYIIALDRYDVTHSARNFGIQKVTLTPVRILVVATGDSRHRSRRFIVGQWCDKQECICKVFLRCHS
jgi:hypothetical protein